ncbi:MAG: hypothetical protein DRJ52_08345 [Thermoprotei archaeon]|nr:MAG: hypothetical protein DRJ52_08345 [Thermoprotei archaeon]
MKTENKLKEYVFDNGALVVRAVFAWLDNSVDPWRLYIWNKGCISAAKYLEYEGRDGKIRHVIVHNYALLKDFMQHYNISVEEARILNELHELTHRATDNLDRTEWRLRDMTETFSHQRLWNPFLLRIIKDYFSPSRKLYK